MAEFLQSQPAVLPATLPAGTRTMGGCVAESEVKLAANGRYSGMWLEDPRGNRAAYEGEAWPSIIAWSSVPAPPEPVEAPKVDRPIRAGDWVEYVDAGGASELTLGERYQVESPRTLGGQPGISLVGKRVHWLAERFKRVDGPHPVGIDYGAEPGAAVLACQHCGDYGATAYTLFDGKLATLCRHCWLNASPSSTATPSPTTCSECKAPAVLTEGPYGNLCGYCQDSTEGGLDSRAHVDRITAHQMRAAQMSDFSPIPGEVAACKRLAAIEQKRPRVNAAERAMLERGHPWEEFDEMESR